MLTRTVAAAAAAMMLAGCASTGVDNTRGRATLHEDPSTAGRVQGIGLESQDIVSMTDRMMRDMLANPILANSPTPPRVIIDSEYFANESSSRINKNLITDRLRVELNRAANGRMVFVARHASNMVEAERALKRDGVVDSGTIRQTRATAGADYRLSGRIMSLDAASMRTGEASRYHQITFEMVDLELGTIVWANNYEFRRSAQDDIIYR